MSEQDIIEFYLKRQVTYGSSANYVSCRCEDGQGDEEWTVRANVLLGTGWEKIGDMPWFASEKDAWEFFCYDITTYLEGKPPVKDAIEMIFGRSA